MSDAPHAFESMFSPSEQMTLNSISQAKAIISEARQNNPFVSNIVASCAQNGLVYVDQMVMLCANLILQHEQATRALEAMHQQVQAGPRKVIAVWKNSDGVWEAMCDDGTQWKIVDGMNGWVRNTDVPPIPQGPV